MPQGSVKFWFDLLGDQAPHGSTSGAGWEPEEKETKKTKKQNKRKRKRKNLSLAAASFVSYELAGNV